MVKKIDRRKRYTRYALKQSLMTLLENKPISNITVKEICMLADINRSTFYAHFSDQYDLLAKIEEEIIKDLHSYLERFKLEEDKMTVKLLEYIEDNQKTFQILLNKNRESGFETKLKSVAKQFMMNHWLDGVDHQLESKYLSTFVISGAIHVIKDWLLNGMDVSKDDMAMMINRFIKNGLSYLDDL
ncbi:TetR/AcrR family transcriptional regulator [Fervidibacillus halotolerans]|uniref:TetR family transcriptional regulator C-terminal domain-containing protein n=1 Tax=Fervidibacillus halotolerans TaxID=2980027 RepID=A0A9E8LYD9_9BACI|nr:TetR-like C-terminal domain-containing protein [Fervidibacillus halotolerans]WAA11692.1 TetR family transcriptional regulator C-terminal domain-containing protein [Fervidibacillus halotolerans]